MLEKVNSWTPSPGDPTPSGSETYRAERTALGIVTHRARIKGKPYAFTRNRATYYHEVDSALGFADFNNPEKMESPAEFMDAACKIHYTFNWFFIDGEQIAYFNSGINPVRAQAGASRPADPRQAQLRVARLRAPVAGAALGRSDRPDQRRPADELLRAGALRGAPADRRPEVDHELEQQAGARLPRLRRRVRYGPVFRSTRLDDRIRSRLTGATRR